MLALPLAGWRTYIAEPRRGRQKWDGQSEELDAVHGNRRRKNRERGKGLMRRRGEIIERTFAHASKQEAWRRSHLRHHENIAKPLLIHISGNKLGLLMRKRFGVRKPRCLQGRLAALWTALIAHLGAVVTLMRPPRALFQPESRVPTLLPLLAGARAAA